MNQIKIGAIISYAAILLNILTGLLYTPWMINTIGKSNYGLYTLAMSVISLFIFDFGLGSAITRYVSKYLAEDKQEMVDKLLGITFKLYLIGDIIIFVSLSIVYFLLPTIYQGLTPEEMDVFKVVYIIASAFCVMSFPFLPLDGVLKSYEKFIQLKSCDFAHKLLVVIFMTICLLMGAGVYALVAINSIASIVMILFKLYVLSGTRIKAIDWKCWDKDLIKSVFGFSIWVTITLLAQRCIFNIAPSLLAAFADSTAITILGIAICLEGYTYTFANALNGMFLPRVTRLLVNDNREEILNLMIRIGRLQIYVMGLICIGFICVGREFINAWMGNGFEETYICALLIILPSFFHLPQDIASSTLIAEGNVKHQAYAFILMALINLSLAYPFTKWFGVTGLCCSIMFSYFVRTIVMDVIFYKQLKLNIPLFFRNTYIQVALPFMFIVVVTLCINHFVRLENWNGFICKSVICISVYVLAVYSLIMKPEEKSLFLKPIIKVKRIICK